MFEDEDEDYLNDPYRKLRDEQHWELAIPAFPVQCAATGKILWVKPAFKGHWLTPRKNYTIWVDKNTMQTLVLKGVIK